MATKRKRSSTSGDATRAFTVVLEDLRAQFLVFGEALRGLHDKVDGHTVILEGHSATLAEHSSILKEHSVTLAEHSSILKEHSSILKEHSSILREHSSILREHSATLGDHSSRFDRVEQDIGLLKIATLENTREIKAIHGLLAKKLDRDEVA